MHHITCNSDIDIFIILQGNYITNSVNIENQTEEHLHFLCLTEELSIALHLALCTFIDEKLTCVPAVVHPSIVKAPVEIKIQTQTRAIIGHSTSRHLDL